MFANCSIPPAADINFDANYVPTNFERLGAIYNIRDSINLNSLLNKMNINKNNLFTS